MDYIEIGSVPSGEPCESLGPNYNPVQAKFECRLFIEQLRRTFGEEPVGARLKIKENHHDFGTYHEVACNYNENNEEACEYAFRCESEMPEFWDEYAKEALAKGYRTVPSL